MAELSGRKSGREEDDMPLNLKEKLTNALKLTKKASDASYSVASNIVKHTLGMPFRLIETAANAPRVVAGKEPLKAPNVPFLGPQPSYFRQYKDEAPEIGKPAALARTIGTAAGDLAGVAGMASFALPTKPVRLPQEEVSTLMKTKNPSSGKPSATNFGESFKYNAEMQLRKNGLQKEADRVANLDFSAAKTSDDVVDRIQKEVGDIVKRYPEHAGRWLEQTKMLLREYKIPSNLTTKLATVLPVSFLSEEKKPSKLTSALSTALGIGKAIGQSVGTKKGRQEMKESFIESTPGSVSAIQQSGASLLRNIQDKIGSLVTKINLPGQAAEYITGGKVKAPQFKPDTTIPDTLEKKAEQNRQLYNSLTKNGIKVADERKFLEKIQDPSFIAKGIGSNAPNLLLSLGVSAPAAVLGAPASVVAGTAFATSALLEGGFAYNEAKDFLENSQRADHKELAKDKSFLEKIAVSVGIVNGLLDALPITKFLTRSKITTPLKRQIIIEAVKRIIGQALSEGSTESVQEIVTNATAKIYDENRDILTNVPEAGFFGGLLGGATGVVGDSGAVFQDVPVGLSLKEVEPEKGEKITIRNKKTGEEREVEYISKSKDGVMARDTQFLLPVNFKAETFEIVKEEIPERKSVKEEFKAGDVINTQGKTNMADPITIREITGNTLRFTDAKGTDFSGMSRSTARTLLSEGSWKRVEEKAVEKPVEKEISATTISKKPLSPEKIPEHNMFEKAFEMKNQQLYERTKKSVDRIKVDLEKAFELKKQIDTFPRKVSDLTSEQRDIKYRFNVLNDKRSKDFVEYWTSPSVSDNSISRLEALKKPTKDKESSYRVQYVKEVKDLISKGYDVPEKIVNQFPEFKKAVDARARYDKGWKTSFANLSVAVNEATKEVFGFKVKRQDGKPITPEQIKEITDAALALEKAIGPFKDIAEASNLTVAHTSGKFPFLRGDAGGLHTGKENTISIGVKMIKAFAHEMFHVFDNQSGTMGELVSKHYSKGGEYNKELMNEALETMNGSRFQIDRALKMKPDMSPEEKEAVMLLKGRLTGYYRTNVELFARLSEQYVAEAIGVSEANDSPEFYREALGYWEKDIFDKLKPKIEAEFKKKITLAREKLGTQPESFKIASEPTEKSPFEVKDSTEALARLKSSLDKVVGTAKQGEKEVEISRGKVDIPVNGRKNIENLLKSIDQNTSGVFDRRSVPIVGLPQNISEVVGDDVVFLSEFVIAKIKGLVKGFDGHPEITDEIIKNIPQTLSDPYRIYLDERTAGKRKNLFIEIDPKHQIVVEVKRTETGRTEINTIFPMGDRTLKQLAENDSLQVVYSRSGETATLPSSLSQQGLSGVRTDKESLPEAEKEVKLDEPVNGVAEPLPKDPIPPPFTEEDSYQILADQATAEEAEYKLENSTIEQEMFMEDLRAIFADMRGLKKEDIAEIEQLKVSEEDLDNARTAYAFTAETLKDHPGRALLKYVSRETGALPEITGKEMRMGQNNKLIKNSEFGIRGDQIIQEILGYENAPDYHTAQNAIDGYKDIRKRLRSLHYQARDIREKIRLHKRFDEFVGAAKRTMAKEVIANHKALTSLVQAAERAGYEKGKAEVGKSFEQYKKEQQDRREKLLTIKIANDLTDYEFSKIRTKKDPRLMDAGEFDAYYNKVREAAEDYVRVKDERIIAEGIIKEKELVDVENLIKALELPPIAQMNMAQLGQLEELLENAKQNDRFLSPRMIETIRNADWGPVKTFREAAAALLKQLGDKVPPQVNDIVYSELDDWIRLPQLAMKDPLHRFIITEWVMKEVDFLNRRYVLDKVITKLTLDSRASRRRAGNASISSKEVREMIGGQPKGPLKKFRQTIFSYLVPDDRLPIVFAQSNETARETLRRHMTPEEIRFGEFIRGFFNGYYNKVIQEEVTRYTLLGIKHSRFIDVYFPHTSRGFLERWRDDGMIQALLGFWNTRILTEHRVDYDAYGDSGEVLGFEKFLTYSMKREGVGHYSQNAAKVMLGYFTAFERKLAIDAITPKAMVAMQVMAKRLPGPSHKGDPTGGDQVISSTRKHIYGLLNTLKGRRKKIAVTQGSRIQAAFHLTNVITTIKYLGGNIIVQLGSVGGGEAMTMRGARIRGWAIGHKRSLTKQGAEIGKKYSGVIGTHPFYETFASASQNAGDTLMSTLFYGFADFAFRARRQFFLGSLTEEEFRTGEVSLSRQAEIKLEIGKWHVFPEFRSVGGRTTEAETLGKFKEWAIVPLQTSAMEVRNLRIRAKQHNESWYKTKEFKSLLLTAVQGIGMYLIVMYALDTDERDQSFIARMKRKLRQELSSLLSSLYLGSSTLESLTRNPVVDTLAQLLRVIDSLKNLERYKTSGPGYKKGDLKAFEQLKDFFTPNVVKQFIPPETTYTTSGGSNIKALNRLGRLKNSATKPKGLNRLSRLKNVLQR